MSFCREETQHFRCLGPSPLLTGLHSLLYSVLPSLIVAPTVALRLKELAPGQNILDLLGCEARDRREHMMNDYTTAGGERASERSRMAEGTGPMTMRQSGGGSPKRGTGVRWAAGPGAGAWSTCLSLVLLSLIS
jgi:hypothetical protein